MDDQRCNGSTPLCFFKFVNPTSVIGKRRTAKEIRVIGGRFVREIDEYLPFHVLIFVIVPPELRSGDAMADENSLCVKIVLRPLRIGSSNVILYEAKRHLLGC